MIPDSATVAVTDRQVSTDVEGEAVILHFEAGIYYGLDGVGARVWEWLRSPVTVSELQARLVSEYEVDPAQCAADLRNLLQELADAGLVEVADAGAA